MTLKEFLVMHFEDYVYVNNQAGHLLDVMVKFIPWWLVVYYGDKQVDVSLRSSGKFDVYDVTIMSE